MKNDKVTRNFIICFDEFLVIFLIERKEVRMMKNRKIFAIVLILMTIMVSSGCNEKKQADNNDTTEEKKVEYCDTLEVKEQGEVMYDVYNERLGCYDISSNEYEFFYETEGVFVYKIVGGFETYTVGSSRYNYFSILNRTENGIEKVMDIDVKDSLTPCDKYKGEYYFLLEKDSLQTSHLDRSIVKYNEKENVLEEVFGIKNEFLMPCIFASDKMYYTIYQKEKDYFELYEFDMDTKKSKKVRDNLQSNYIYSYEDTILILNEDKIEGLEGNLYFQFRNTGISIDYIKERKEFIQVYSNENGDLQCDVWNLEKKEMVMTKSGYLGHSVVNEKLRIYTQDGYQDCD